MASKSNKIVAGGELARGHFSSTEDDKLLSFEKLDRSSPDLWPEKIPGVTEYEVGRSIKSSGTPRWLADLEKDDINLLQEIEEIQKHLVEKCDRIIVEEFGSLTLSQLMEKVRGLQNLAYQLGLEEAREMTRGKFLNILGKPKPPR